MNGTETRKSTKVVNLCSRLNSSLPDSLKGNIVLVLTNTAMRRADISPSQLLGSELEIPDNNIVHMDNGRFSVRRASFALNPALRGACCSDERKLY